jgi:hypothetical protein
MNYITLLQDAPPNTSGYMVAGYVVFFVILAIYLLSMFARRRNLERDLRALETIQAESIASARPARSRQAASTAVRRPKPAVKRPPSRKRASRRK